MKPKSPVIAPPSAIGAALLLVGLLASCRAPEPAPTSGPDIRLSGVRAFRHSGEDLDAVAEAGEATLAPDGSAARLSEGRLLLPGADLEIAAPEVDLDLAGSEAHGDEGASVAGPGYQLDGEAFALNGDEGTVTLTGSVRATDDAPLRPPAPSRPNPSAEPVEIDADEVVLHGRTNKAVFTGRVAVTRGSYRLTCRRLTVSYGENQRITHLLAEGDVRVTETDRVVTARKAEFDNASEVLTLSGDAVLTQGNNVIRGERVIFTLGTDEVKVERVRARVRVDEASSLGESTR